MVVLLVLLVGMVAAGLMVAAGRRWPRDVASGGTRPASHWLVRRLAEAPRLSRLVGGVDRSVIGGAVMAVTLASIWVAGLVVGWILESIGTDSGPARWDTAVADWGSAHVSHLGLRLLVDITQLGATPTVAVALLAVGLAEATLWRRPSAAGYLAAIGLGEVALSNAIKLLVGRARPPVHHLVAASGSSFPSGHSVGAAACWAAVALVLSRHLPARSHRWLAAAAVGVAMAVAASRALLGVHWLTDVVGGLVIGWTWFFVVTLVFGGRLLRLGQPAEVIQRSEGVEPGRNGQPNPAGTSARLNGGETTP